MNTPQINNNSNKNPPKKEFFLCLVDSVKEAATGAVDNITNYDKSFMSNIEKLNEIQQKIEEHQEEDTLIGNEISKAVKILVKGKILLKLPNQLNLYKVKRKT